MADRRGRLPQRLVKVFLDTDVLVSAFATRGVCEDVLRIVLGQHAWISGEPVLGELERVLTSTLNLPASRVGDSELLEDCDNAPLMVQSPREFWESLR